MAYSATETAAITAAAPLTYERAAELASELGKTHRSVIAKAKSLGVEYIPKAPATKRPRGVTKADIVARIEAQLDTTLDGLDKAPMAALQRLAELTS